MKIVFVHQNFPGQFGRLASIFAAEGHEVVTLGMYSDNPVARRVYERLGFRCDHRFSSRALVPAGEEDTPISSRPLDGGHDHDHQ